MNNILSIIQVVLACAMVLLVLLQERGSGMGEAFGDSGGFASQRRGVERGIFIVTIIVLALFIAVSLTNILI